MVRDKGSENQINRFESRTVSWLPLDVSSHLILEARAQTRSNRTLHRCATSSPRRRWICTLRRKDQGQLECLFEATTKRRYYKETRLLDTTLIFSFRHLNDNEHQQNIGDFVSPCHESLSLCNGTRGEGVAHETSKSRYIPNLQPSCVMMKGGVRPSSAHNLKG